VLLEDLGDALFARLCDDPEHERALYAAAIDLLADLQAAPQPVPTADWSPPPYDAPFLMREMRLVPEWYLPAATGAATAPDLAAEFEALAAR
jgi:N-acetylmuramate 1-kinase